jgi:AraC-like DNA-binding protein
VPYTEISPPADLAAYVDRLWLRSTRGGGRVHRVLPDGCVDVIVRADRGEAELVGAMTRALVVADEPAEMVAVRFRPGAAAVFAGCALGELTDRNPALSELSIPGAGSLAGRVSDARGTEARLAALIGWLRARLAAAGAARRGPDPLVAHAVARLSAGSRVDCVADELGVSRQYLARGFRREVGLSPKQLARIARMQRAASVIGGRRGRPGAMTGAMARLAVELGYFDQAHLANELRALIDLTPAALAAEQPITLSHLYG